jgi:hypothetical protein
VNIKQAPDIRGRKTPFQNNGDARMDWIVCVLWLQHAMLPQLQTVPNAFLVGEDWCIVS